MEGVPVDEFHNDWIKLLDAEEIRKIRRQYWTFVIWPDSKEFEVIHKAGVKFERFLQYVIGEAVIPCLVSPIHDKDVNEHGELVKPHYHLIAFFEKPQRYKVVLEMFRFGCGFESLKYLQPVANIRSMMRYLVHLDNPWKAQYNVDDVIEIAGAEYVIEKETASEIVVNKILNENITTFTLLWNSLAHNPSAQKWVIANPNIIKNLLYEQHQMRVLIENCSINGTVTKDQTKHILSDFLGKEENEVINEGQ